MKKYFFTGLATLLPLAITVWFALFLLNFLTRPFMGIASNVVKVLHIPPHLAHLVSEIIILASLFLFVLALGMVARWFLINLLLKWSERLFHRIPLVNKVYKTFKEIILALFSAEKKSFQQVVMLSFPYEGCFTLGLIARSSPETCNTSAKEDMVSIFIPTTPNPTTGFLLLRRKSDLICLEMSPEEAIKYIVSCGVVQPHYKQTGLAIR